MARLSKKRRPNGFPKPRRGELTPVVAPGLKMTLAEMPAVRSALKVFEEAAGGRGALATTLLQIPELSDAQMALVRQLADPQFDRRGLSAICADAGLTVGQLFTLYKDALVARAHVKSLQHIERKIEDVTKEVLRQSERHTEPCPTCLGSGQLSRKPTTSDPEPAPYGCYTCSGHGTIPASGSIEHQKLAYELIGLAKKPGGVQVNTQINTVNSNGTSGGGSLEQIQQAAAQILFRKSPPVVDVTPQPQTAVVDSAV